MKVACVLYGEILAPVVAAQTLPLLAELRRRGHEVALVALTSPRRLLRPSRYAAALDAARAVVEGGLRVLTHPPRRLPPPGRWRLPSSRRSSWEPMSGGRFRRWSPTASSLSSRSSSSTS